MEILGLYTSPLSCAAVPGFWFLAVRISFCPLLIFLISCLFTSACAFYVCRKQLTDYVPDSLVNPDGHHPTKRRSKVL